MTNYIIHSWTKPCPEQLFNNPSRVLQIIRFFCTLFILYDVLLLIREKLLLGLCALKIARDFNLQLACLRLENEELLAFPMLWAAYFVHNWITNNTLQIIHAAKDT